MAREILLIFPHQMFESHTALTKDKIICFLEDERYFSAYNFHKKKLLFHRASMRAYATELSKEGFCVIYYEWSTVRDEKLGVFAYAKNNKISVMHYIDPVDNTVEKQLIKTAKEKNITLIRYETSHFLASSHDIKDYLGEHNKYSMAAFYKEQRKRYGILVDNSRPVGNIWSFDTENRKKLPKDLHMPPLWTPQSSVYTDEAQSYIEKLFLTNPGNGDNFIYPVTHHDAKLWLEDFLHHRLVSFGDYQDAISKTMTIGYHSLLSPLLNAGLLTPAYVIEKTLTHGEKYAIPLNSLEGFIRQILGWREYVRGIYLIKGEYQKEQNFFNHTQKLPGSFWNASTGIEPLDDAIRHVLESSYGHHIERLMILGNFMLLTEISPDEVYAWFMQMYIDAYDWVMVPNIYGMAEYADGGLMVTKPYISGAPYILKMSDYKKGPWCDIWNGLYWRFIYKNKKLIMANPRLAVMGIYLAKMSESSLRNHIRIAEDFLARYY